MSRNRRHRGELSLSTASVPDRSWPARAAGLRGDKPAQWALVAAIVAPMAALLAWIALVLDGRGDIRSDPAFWLLSAPFVAWCWAVQSLKRWAIQALWLALLGAPCLSLVALLAARAFRDPMAQQGHLATPLAMEVILGVTVLIAAIGLAALRRSSLPGGTAAPVYLPPGTPLPGQAALAPNLQRGLMIGSLALSGTLINGMLFGIVSMIDTSVPSQDSAFDEPLWLLSIPILPIVATGAAVLRGSIVVRSDPVRAAPLLRWGLRMGAVFSLMFVVLLWAWPTVPALKTGMSVFMVPMALAALWGARKAGNLLAIARGV